MFLSTFNSFLKSSQIKKKKKLTLGGKCKEVRLVGNVNTYTLIRNLFFRQKESNSQELLINKLQSSLTQLQEKYTLQEEVTHA